MELSRRIEIGAIITLSLAVIAFAFFLGGLNNRVDQLDPDAIEAAKASLRGQLSRSRADSLPIGTIVPYAGAVPESESLPAGWLLCNGNEVPDGEEFNELRAVLEQARWGKRAGKALLPDLRGMFLRGVDDPDGPGGMEPAGIDPDAAARIERIARSAVGDHVGTLQADGFRKHEHDATVADPGHTHGYKDEKQPADNTFDAGGGRGLMDHDRTTATSRTGITVKVKDRGGNETRPINSSVNWIIKATRS